MAGRRLRESFFDFLAHLKEHPVATFRYDAEKFIKRQYSAALEYKSFLRDREKLDFNKAWESYYKPNCKDEWEFRFTRKPKELEEQLEKQIEDIVKLTHISSVIEKLRRRL